MRVCQNDAPSCYIHKAPTSQAGALIYPKVFVSLGIQIKFMAKLHFRDYTPNQLVLFPQRIDENISENDPVRIINSIVDSLDLSLFYGLYSEVGRNAYHPRMMLKVVLYAYMNNTYSCRKMESLLLRDIHYIWLAGYEKPDFITINRFRNRVKDEINNIFTQVVIILALKGLISLDVEYIDGTKIESKANKYTFVWRKHVEKDRAKLMEKISVLLSQIDDAIAQDNAAELQEQIEFAPSLVTERQGCYLHAYEGGCHEQRTDQAGVQSTDRDGESIHHGLRSILQPHGYPYPHSFPTVLLLALRQTPFHCHR